ncbi:MAG: HAMP domain-containing histidine kinase [Oscillospiraceae bacterium]|nr:HAMP domain-containing histidine kinase [Oscillospiraceae bacterium]
MLITPIVLIGVISVCFLIIFILKFPVEELNITRAALLDPKVFSQALGEFFKQNPGAIMYFVLWGIICITIAILSTTIVTHFMTKSVEKPIRDLARAADYIREGNLDFEVMGSDYEEIDSLCSNFDTMRKELRMAQEREKYMQKERSMLLANISHDLKTPVTSIKGYVEGIRDGVADTPEKLERYLDTIHAKAETIDELVNNLSMFSKLELSKMIFDFETADINAFLRGFLEDYRLDIEKNGVELRTDISDETAFVKLDYEKMSRVFSNIIDNAVKYKSENNPTLEVSAFKRDKGVYISVSDNGIGIDENEIKNVFEGFYRADASRSIKGSGLGLGIVKQIVEKHGGKIWLKSDGIGKGTTAVIYLPIAEEK